MDKEKKWLCTGRDELKLLNVGCFLMADHTCSALRAGDWRGEGTGCYHHQYWTGINNYNSNNNLWSIPVLPLPCLQILYQVKCSHLLLKHFTGKPLTKDIAVPGQDVVKNAVCSGLSIGPTFKCTSFDIPSLVLYKIGCPVDQGSLLILLTDMEFS